MPIHTPQWCQAPIWPAHTGRPAKYCRPAGRQAARRQALFAECYPHPWKRRALAEGWRPQTRPADEIRQDPQL